MSFYMSVMINRAIASKITKILSLENVKICPFDKMHPIQPNEFFFQISLRHILAKSRSNVFFEKFDPQYATGMTFKWLIVAKVDQISSKMKKHFKNMKKCIMFTTKLHVF